MLDRELTLFQFVMNYTRMLTADIPEAQLADQPASGLNHPAWILGHLAIGTDFAIALMGGEKRLDPSWMTQFGPGSQVVADLASYPKKATLLEALESGHQGIKEAAPSVTAEHLRSPNTHLLQEPFPTMGDLIGHLLTTHPCTHLGQLSAWRRLKGLGPVLGI